MIIAITSLKGGVGKSTLSQNIAVCLAHAGNSVCIVDTDTNQNSMKWFGRRPEGLPDITAVGVINEEALQKTIRGLKERYEVIIIDGKPSVEKMVTKIILASDLLLVPVKPGAQDLEAVMIFIESLKQANAYRPTQIPTALVLNEFKPQTILHNQILQELQHHTGLPVLKTKPASRVSYGEANMIGKGVYEYDDPNAKYEITNLTNEIIEIAKHSGLTS